MTNTLISAIEQLENMQDRLSKVVAGDDDINARELTKLRSGFSMGLLQLGRQASEARAFAADRERLAAFKKKHLETQNQLSNHQAEWMLSNIGEDPDGYRKATAQLKQDQQAFFAWAKQAAS